MVMTSEGMLSREISAPLIQPQAAPVAKPASERQRAAAAPAWSTRQNTAVPSAMIEGNDRSISPVMTTKVSASAMMAKSGVVSAKAL